MSAQTLLLVDGTAVAYRAFYAIRELSTRDGKPTNAVFGFIKMLQQLRLTWKPTHWAVVFDGGLPEERMAVLETYKAQRTPMPDALREQFAPIEDFLARSAVPAIRIEGQEADDVMATLVAAAESGGMDAVLATSDKDLFQMVGPRTCIVPPSKIGARMGPGEVLEKTGVRPEQVVEWLALTGDTVDNIPGVPGVGPKTAAKLLGEYGTIDGLWAHLDGVKSDKLRESLAAHREVVARNVGLITLRRDVPMPVDWDAMKVRPVEPARLVPFYDAMEFRSLAAEMRTLDREGPTLNFGD